MDPNEPRRAFFMALYDVLIFMPLLTKITTAFEFSARN